MEKKRVKRKKPSALPSILSLTAVMFLLGLLGSSVVGFKGLSAYWLENSSIDLYFQDDIEEGFVREYETEIQKKPWVKRTRFVSRAEGMSEMGDKYDPNFMSYVETVTLPLSLEIYPKANYANPDFFEQLTEFFKQQPAVEDVIFQRNWLSSMTNNLQKAQWAIGGISLILCLVSIVLIQSSVRLGIFANRHTIKSMQLVGATNGFIIRPFVWKFIKYALLSFPLSALLIWLLIWVLPTYSTGLNLLGNFHQHMDLKLLGILSIAIAIFGILLAALSSWISTRRFLNTRIENLY
ncbi:MAG: cell division protein FtsX [Bacteroidia bacterium]|jgi:cell division transport system permease protein